MNDLSEKVLALRNFNEINREYIEVQVTNSVDSNDMFVTCRERFPIIKEKLTICSDLAASKGIPIEPIASAPQKTNFSIFFSVNHRIFEDFLLRFGGELPYDYKNGLLKVGMKDSEDH